ncbi:MAG TPA: HNH endonuclease [Melioribacteraceae bacterium]|nr:HNH endonuclease [Melioribacteraceae bacterium]
MPLLYYWRGDNYRRDLDFGASYHLNQSNKLLHEIEIGDSLWAFTKTNNGKYVLASELVITAKTYNPSNYRYGRYRVWGDLERSKYFKVIVQPNFENILRNFSITINAKLLGQSFQGHAALRKISYQDNLILKEYSKLLPIEERARLLPEERLEALIYSKNPEAIYKLFKEVPHGIAEKRIEYLYTKSPRRNAEFVVHLNELYKGKCQICSWDPIKHYGRNICQVHHLQWLSRGGEDNIKNLVLLCPNHHSAVHRLDAVFDFSSYSFNFYSRTEALSLNLHL